MREIKHLSIHQWLRSAIHDSQQPTSPIGFLFLKLPPPPCAVLLVSCLKYDCCVYNHFVTISVGAIIVVIQICWRLGYGTITMTIRIHRKGRQDMIVLFSGT